MTIDNLKTLLYTINANNAKFDVAERTNFWVIILNCLHKISLLEKITEESIIDNIQEQCDFSDEATIYIAKENNKYVIKIQDTQFKDFWNESVQNAWEDLLKYYNNDENIFTPWAINDIKKADAAASYAFEQEFVKPWKNIDGQSYKNVRGSDAFEFIIENSTHSQFTHSKDKNWIRLIMSMNPRRVEVEDLDRNFWVIGQSLSIISKVLFDEDSPTKKIFNNILREITEQWENVLYLWGEYELLTGRNNIINLILDLPNDGLHPYRKFDNFDKDTWSIEDGEAFSKYTAQLESRFNFLTHKYSKSKISLLVRKRELNYKNNYYSREIYPYYGYYDGNNWTWYPIFYSNTGNRLFRANINDYKYLVYAYNVNTKEYGRYSVTNRPTIAVRIIPSIERGGINPKISFKFYDAVEAMIKGQSSSRLLKTYEGEVSNNFIQIVKTQDITNTERDFNFVAHRGYQTEKSGTKANLDNTLPNFRSAIEAGFDYLETDIRFGSDCCVLSHNREVDIDGQIIDVRNDITKANHWVENNNHNKRFPLLSDLLTLEENIQSSTSSLVTLKKSLYLEIKIETDSYKFPDQWQTLLSDDIRNAKIGLNQITWISFDADILKTIANNSKLCGAGTRLGYLVDSSHGTEMTNVGKLGELYQVAGSKVFVSFNIDTLDEHQDIYEYCTDSSHAVPMETYTIDTQSEYNMAKQKGFINITSNDITPYTVGMETGRFDEATVNVGIYPGEVLTKDYQEWM